ncbi:head decoration protein [Mycolicibacterium goodii]|uniref:head decoration protein n=1 Tax=Mycolicibacterium goodii TaxID=134601 RepID=UPI001BDCB9E2|nr:head decoration protein [Mycolicibacterium goodii]MBU8830837.1 head decoration protein [Mycolicibacterium goodii]
MSSDITVHSSAYHVDNREWIVGTHGADLTPGVTLDISKFTAGTHYPNGFIPSGTVLGKVTASGLYGPYDNSATDGREVAAGLLFSFIKAVDATGKTNTKVGGAIFVHGGVKEAKLPANSGIDAAAKTDLSKIVWL